jgi:hypothetical protein
MAVYGARRTEYFHFAGFQMKRCQIKGKKNIGTFQ